VNEAGERDAVLLLGRSKGVSIADEAWLKVPLMKAFTKERFQKGTHTLLRDGLQASADDVGEPAQTVVIHSSTKSLGDYSTHKSPGIIAEDRGSRGLATAIRTESALGFLGPAIPT
jgi:hypothetical protein